VDRVHGLWIGWHTHVHGGPSDDADIRTAACCSTTLPVSRLVSLSLFLFSSREGGKEAMGGHARGRRFVQG
jgi:hypothetical protein